MKLSNSPQVVSLIALIGKYMGPEVVKSIGYAAIMGRPEPVPAEVQARAEALANDFERLGPTYIKFGQILSSRPDLLSEPYRVALSRLQNNVKPLPWETVEEVIVGEFGRPIDELYGSFDQTPLAAASIGQVHRATLLDGTAVAVKVQRPGARQVMLADLDALNFIARILQARTAIGRSLKPVRILAELRSALLRELNYEREAASLRRLKESMRSFTRIVVPTPYADRTTLRVLTMSFIEGEPITQTDTRGAQGIELANELFGAYLHQIVVDGFFHADPHPGNLLLTPDGNVAVLDLGMTASLPKRMQRGLIKLLLALADQRAEDAATLFVKLAKDPADADVERFEAQVVEFIQESSADSLGSMEVGRLILELQRVAADTRVTVPSQFTFLGKTLLQLDEVGRRLDPDFNPQDALRQQVASMFQNTAQENLSLPRLLQTFLETDELVSELPNRLSGILSLVADNELSFNVKVKLADLVVGRLTSVGNRLALAIVAAGLILGVAMLAPTLGTYVTVAAGLAFLFLLALLVAMSMFTMRR